MENVINEDRAVERFVGALKIATVSYSDRSRMDYSKFKDYIRYIKKSYPTLRKKLELEFIGEYNFLYHWKGSNENLKPIVLMAHYDVVPVESEEAWEQPPFGGIVKDGVIWGRGSLDDKLSMIGILEAVESLCEEDYTPERDIYLAFGHDEEIGGEKGAQLIVEEFKKRGINFGLVLDEGAIVTLDMIAGVNKPIALIGVTEKGMMNVMVSVRGAGGHASMPPEHTAAGLLAKVLVAIEKNKAKPRVTKTLRAFMSALSDHLPSAQKFVFKHHGLFKGLILSGFAKKPSTDAMIRTTRAITMLSGSSKENILPQKASALINVRLLHPDTVESAYEDIKQIAKNVRGVNPDNVEVEVLYDRGVSNPSIEADVNSEGFKRLEQVIRSIFGDVGIVPFIMVGGTDSRHYAGIADSILKFLPVQLRKSDMETIHANNERVSVENFIRAIEFYRKVITL